MSIDESVTHWLEELRAGDEGSALKLWQLYFRRLVRFASQRLPTHLKREFDEEDVALSAFQSLCVGVRRGRFPDLRDRNDLWSLLLVITARKAQHRVRRAMSQKRGGGRVRGESALEDRDASGATPIQQVIGSEATPEFAAQLAEESERLLRFLEDESLRTLARLKMEGHTNREIADTLGCGARTVERRLNLIRKLWLARTSDDA